VLRRAFTLWVQILISLLIIAVFAGAAALWHDDDLLEDADAVVSNPLQTTAAILALLHQLENANILPLYIALLLMTPLLLVLARRDDRLMLAASAGIYLAARAFSSTPSRGSSSSPSAFSQDVGLSAAVSPTTRGSSPLASLSSRSPRWCAPMPSAMRRGCGRTCTTCLTAARPISDSRGSCISSHLRTSSTIPGSPD
jgi:hypothetical protein